jgi:hypothetical protein
MIMKRIQSIIPAAVIGMLLFAAMGCEKLPGEGNGSHYLRLDHVYTNVADVQGSTRIFKVESDVSWQLSVAPVGAAPADWLILDKYLGHGTQEVTITATRDNHTGGHRLAEVTAYSIGNPSLAPARMTVVQRDSTFTKK